MDSNSAATGKSGVGIAQGGYGPGLEGWRMPSPSIDRRLREALDDEQFVLYCQPIVELESRRVRQHEVLLRLQEGNNHIAPGFFLEAAERLGMVREIDRMVVRGAIAILASGGAETLGVNLSGSSLGDPELLALIESELGSTGVEPSRLVFEVTESAAIYDMSAAIDFANELRAMGCQLALDDFGVGFGSLYYLKHLPFDYVKIDGEFVRELTANPRDRAMIAGVVEMARGLELITIAEFVGDEPTIEVLLELGVQWGQGYHLGVPAPAAAAAAAAAKQSGAHGSIAPNGSAGSAQ